AENIEPGATYEVGTVLAYVQQAGTPGSTKAGVGRVPARGRRLGGEAPEVGFTEKGHSRPQSGPDVPAATVYASPKARQQANERGIDLSRVKGSGKDGLIVAADLEEAGDAVWQGRAIRERRKLDGARKRVARATTEAWAAPHFVQMIDVDVTNLAARRKTWR